MQTSTKHPVVREISRRLRLTHRSVRSVVKTPEDHHLCPTSERLLGNIVAKYKSSSLSETLSKSPPVRGPHGLADIMLTMTAKPRIQRPFRLVGEREAALAELIEEFIARRWLEPSTANWSSPAFVVPKPRPNEWRLVVDYRWLNECTVPDAYPLPLMTIFSIGRARTESGRYST